MMEYVVIGIKQYIIIKDEYRNLAGGFSDSVMKIVCELHNLRLRFRPRQEVKLQGL